VFQLDRKPTPPELRLIAFTPRPERMPGSRSGGRLGQPLAALGPALEGSALVDAARAVARPCPVPAPPPRRSRRWHRFAFRAGRRRHRSSPDAVPLPAHQVGLALEDVTAQVTSGVIQSGERRALRDAGRRRRIAESSRWWSRGDREASVDIPRVDRAARRDRVTHVKHGAAPGLPAASTPRSMPADRPRAGSCRHRDVRRAPVIAPTSIGSAVTDTASSPARTASGRAGHSRSSDQQDTCSAASRSTTHARDIDDTARELRKRAAHRRRPSCSRPALDEQRRALAGRIEAAREDERTTIARDVHDHLGQALTALKLDVGGCSAGSRTSADQKLDDMARATDEILRAVRRIASDLRPRHPDDLGLAAAIEWKPRTSSGRTQVRCECAPTHRSPARARPGHNVFRIFQERHQHRAPTPAPAASTRAPVSITASSASRFADDGNRACRVGPRGTTLGILGMRDGPWRLGGECTVQAPAAPRTIVTVVRPAAVPAERIADLAR